MSDFGVIRGQDSADKFDLKLLKIGIFLWYTVVEKLVCSVTKGKWIRRGTGWRNKWVVGKTPLELFIRILVTLCIGVVLLIVV